MQRHAVILSVVLTTAGAAAAFGAEAPTREKWIVGTSTTASAEGVPEAHRRRPIQRFESIDAYAVEMTADEAAQLRRTPGIRWVEPDYEARLIRTRPAAGPVASDAVASAARSLAQSLPWGVVTTRAPELWPLTQGSGIRVGVVDTGIDFTNIDFRQVYERRSRILRRPPYGFDFINNDDDPTDDQGHGTHVAGTIAATDNAWGVIGVAPRAELHALKVLDAEGSGNASSVVRAIDYAIAHELDVLNFSLGFDVGPNSVKEAVARATAAGIVLVAASGNGFDEGAAGLAYPAAFSEVIAVGAIDDTEAIAGFSQRGTNLDVVAPGVGVFSTIRKGTGRVAEITRSESSAIEATAMTGSPVGTVSGEYVYAGLGKVGEFPASVQGKIALISRGEITFNEKARNAMQAGATAAIIFNNLDGGFLGTLIRSDEAGNPIEDEFPVTVGISKADGEALRNAGTGSLSVDVRSTDWGTNQGTSMASPHVAGVAALLRALVPEATPAQIHDAISQGARDLGAPGWDSTFGWGIVDAVGAARVLAPERVSGLTH